MTREDSLKVISQLHDIIGALSIKWGGRPRSDAEAAIIRELHNALETVRKAHEDAQQWGYHNHIEYLHKQFGIECEQPKEEEQSC